jgi:hypothetical protein
MAQLPNIGVSGHFKQALSTSKAEDLPAASVAICTTLPVYLRMKDAALHCNFLRILHRRLRIPTVAWLQIVDFVGLFDSSGEYDICAADSVQTELEIQFDEHRKVMQCLQEHAHLKECALDDVLDKGSGASRASCIETNDNAEYTLGQSVSRSQQASTEYVPCSEQVQPEIAVVEECTHDEQAAAPDDVDGIINEVLWASAVEHRIQNNVSATTSGAEAMPESQPEAVENVTRYVVQLKFNKCHKQFWKSLETAPELATVREGLSAAGHSFVLPSNAKIFVYPEHYQGVTQAIDARGERLFADHVLIEPEFESIVKKVVAKVAQPKPGSRSVIEFPVMSSGVMSQASAAQGDRSGQNCKGEGSTEDTAHGASFQVPGFRVTRTFLDFEVPSSLCDARSEKTAWTY